MIAKGLSGMSSVTSRLCICSQSLSLGHHCPSDWHQCTAPPNPSHCTVQTCISTPYFWSSTLCYCKQIWSCITDKRCSPSCLRQHTKHQSQARPGCSILQNSRSYSTFCNHMLSLCTTSLKGTISDVCRHSAAACASNHTRFAGNSPQTVQASNYQQVS